MIPKNQGLDKLELTSGKKKIMTKLIDVHFVMEMIFESFHPVFILSIPLSYCQNIIADQIEYPIVQSNKL